METTKYPPCGRLCDAATCEGKRLFYETRGKEGCGGCVEAEGSPKGCIYSKHPRQYKNIKICPIWECSLENKVEHCGQCLEFPCKKFLSWYDPKSRKKSVLPYIGLLSIRENLGTKEWIKWIKLSKKK